MARDLDIIIFGATGDTGVVGCCYLFFKGKKLGISSWAPAGRNLGKLQKDVLDRFQGQQPGPDGLAPSQPIQADAGDHQSLLKMCARTRCVLSCAGPFTIFGEGVVRACVEAGTNYVDITGEMPWVEKMNAKYGEEALKKGISIVNCAGYDSVPPDLATFLAAKAIEKKGTGESLERFEAFVGASGGAMPTGTINTMIQLVDDKKDEGLSAITFGLLGRETPPKETDSTETLLSTEKGSFVPDVEQSNLKRNLFWTLCPGYSRLAGQFCLGHFMAPCNVHAVHFTAAKAGYGGLVYRERMAGLSRGALSLFGLLPMLIGAAIGALVALSVALPFASKVILKLRDLINTPLQKRVRDMVFNGYQPTGKTYVHGFGISQGGHTKVNVKIHSKYDPGLGFTMLSACVVAAEVAKRCSTSDKTEPGFNSAVFCLGGEALAEKLRANGVVIDVNVQ